MEMDAVQQEMADWVVEAFGEASLRDTRERAMRLLEEALELAQATGLEPTDARALVSHVFSRPPGDVAQEVAGVTTTLAAYCAGAEVPWSAAVTRELERMWPAIPQIREKQASKPHANSPASIAETT